MRASGILMHISSLPSPYGIGTLGKAAYEFADFLKASGQHYWQLLPIGPTSYGDSPYQSVSSWAGNPYFIDLDMLIEDGLLTCDEVNAYDWQNHQERVDYGFQYYARFELLRKAFERGRMALGEEFEQFKAANPWLADYALFMAVKKDNNMQCWENWPEDIRLRKGDAVAVYSEKLAEDVAFYGFVQFLFFRQWTALADYVHGLGIELVGDLPIYVPYDSCDAWSNPSLFQLDEMGKPKDVAGVPPDYFSEDGQLWGNPLYDWDKMAQDDFSWWKARIRAVSRMFDVIRIDHFRGLESYWAVPYGEPTARNGRWVKGPDKAFIQAMKNEFPQLHMIAEDLGFLTQEVIDLQKMSGFPGMKVLEFAFDPREPGNYLPHRYDRNCICYIGTHDNETLTQWLETQSEEVIAYTMEYCGIANREDCRWGIIRTGMASIADTFITQMQDYLGLGAASRMNEPGVLGACNWTWRMEQGALTEQLAEKIKRMTQMYERLVVR